MGNVRDATACGGHRRNKGNPPHNDDKPFGLNGDDHVQVNDPVREQNTVGQEKSEDPTRCADDWYKRMWAGENTRDRRPNTANEEVLCELAGSPQKLELRPEHIERKHIEQDMEETAVEEYIGDELPQIIFLCYFSRNETKFGVEGWSSGELIKNLK